MLVDCVWSSFVIDLLEAIAKKISTVLVTDVLLVRVLSNLPPLATACLRIAKPLQMEGVVVQGI